MCVMLAQTGGPYMSCCLKNTSLASPAHSQDTFTPVQSLKLSTRASLGNLCNNWKDPGDLPNPT